MLTDSDVQLYSRRLRTLTRPASAASLRNSTIHQDFFEAAAHLPDNFVDLLVVDPPYNIHKEFNSTKFRGMADEDYERWVDSWMSLLTRTLKATASAYVCCDWRSSSSIYRVMTKYFTVRNRITWERERGRGAERNWKNCSEDVWYGTVSDKYTFDAGAVKLKRKVLAPYRDGNGQPKDWSSEHSGNFRLTYPSNFWADITVPFWSMPENTDHPTQKSEKLLAKIIMASSNSGDFILDPFLGSGTTSVVARKLGRYYCGVEIDKTYACLAEKRLEMAEYDHSIQGYENRVFWERNTISHQSNNGGRQDATNDGEFTLEPLWRDDE